MQRTRPLIAAGTFLLTLILAGCGPVAPAPTAAAPRSPAAATAATTSAPATAPTTLPAPAAPAAPSPTPARPTATRPVPAAPTPTPHPAKPAPHTTAPAPAPASPAPVLTPSTASCSIRSDAGNCYQAGQFCRDADLGKSTTNAAGRPITCVMESGKAHWHY